MTGLYVPISTLFFDLDGTISNNFDGIWRSLNHALERLALPQLTADAVLPFIGPPFRESLPRAYPGIDTERAIALYRERYEVHGWAESSAYAGIAALLPVLREAGYRMAICTSKPRIFAERIVARFGFDHFFEGIHGPELDGRFDHKPELLAHLLTHYGVAARQCVMIGDRDRDIEAARHNSTHSIGVLWGFGDADELSRAGADHLVAHPRELSALIATL